MKTEQRETCDEEDWPTDPEEMERLAKQRVDELMSEQAKKVSLGQYGGGDPGLRAMREKIGDVKKLGHAEDGVVTEIVGVETEEQKVVVERVVENLRTIFDPEIPLNIYDLGLIYRVAIDPTNGVKVDMTLTAPGCPVAGELVEQVRKAALSAEGVTRAEVELVWEPQWTKERLSEAARLELGL